MAREKQDIEDNVIEIEVNDKMIGELILKLNELKESREHIHIDVKNNKQLLIHHEEDKLK